MLSRMVGDPTQYSLQPVRSNRADLMTNRVDRLKFPNMSSDAPGHLFEGPGQFPNFIGRMDSDGTRMTIQFGCALAQCGGRRLEDRQRPGNGPGQESGADQAER